MLGIRQGREWGLASLNEFRAFFKLQPYASFGTSETISLSLSLSVHLSLYDNDRANDKLAEVNPDPSVAEACKVLWLPTYSALSVLTETQWKRSTDIQTTSSSIQGFW